MLVIKTARPTRLAAQVINAVIVISEHDIILEGERAGRAAILIPTSNVKRCRSVGNNCIVSENYRATLTEIKRQSILCATEVR